MKDLHRLWSLGMWSLITVTIYLTTTISSGIGALRVKCANWRMGVIIQRLFHGRIKNQFCRK